MFIAGGAGITLFLAILRDLARRGELGGQTLIFSNKTPRDVICEHELRPAAVHGGGQRRLTDLGAQAESLVFER